MSNKINTLSTISWLRMNDAENIPHPFRETFEILQAYAAQNSYLKSEEHSLKFSQDVQEFQSYLLAYTSQQRNQAIDEYHIYMSTFLQLVTVKYLG